MAISSDRGPERGMYIYSAQRFRGNKEHSSLRAFGKLTGRGGFKLGLEESAGL